jgi:hypothetical protein
MLPVVFGIHRLVAAAFLKEYQSQLHQLTNLLSVHNKAFDVHHRDAKTSNNKNKNLEIITSKQNLVGSNGDCVVVKPVYKRSCYETYGLNSDQIKYYLDNNQTYAYMGQIFNIVTWKKLNKKIES